MRYAVSIVVALLLTLVVGVANAGGDNVSKEKFEQGLALLSRHNLTLLAYYTPPNSQQEVSVKITDYSKMKQVVKIKVMTRFVLLNTNTNKEEEIAVLDQGELQEKCLGGWIWHVICTVAGVQQGCKELGLMK